MPLVGQYGERAFDSQIWSKTISKTSNTFPNLTYRWHLKVSYLYVTCFHQTIPRCKTKPTCNVPSLQSATAVCPVEAPIAQAGKEIGKCKKVKVKVISKGIKGKGFANARGWQLSSNSRFKNVKVICKCNCRVQSGQCKQLLSNQGR